MSSTFALAASLQAAATVLAYRRVRGHAFASPGFLLLVAATVYGTFGETLIRYGHPHSPAVEYFRAYVTEGQIDGWLLLLGFGSLVYACSYAAAPRKRSEPEPFLIPWRMTATLAAPLYLARIGITPGRPETSQIGIISDQFLLVGSVIVALGLLHTIGSRWTIPILAIQTVLISALGQRLEPIAAALMLFAGLAHAGRTVQRKTILACFALTVLAATSISTFRATRGREAFGSDLSSRISALAAGTASSPTLIDSRTTSQRVADDFLYRFDGNTFPAIILAALNRETMQPVGISSLSVAATIATPHIINPAKTNTGRTYGTEKGFIFAQATGRRPAFDFIPTYFGVLSSYAGPWALILILAALGYVVALLENRMTQSNLRSLLALLIATQIVAYYEQDMVRVLTGARSLAVALIVFPVLAGIQARRRIKKRSPAGGGLSGAAEGG